MYLISTKYDLQLMYSIWKINQFAYVNYLSLELTLKNKYTTSTRNISCGPFRNVALRRYPRRYLIIYLSFAKASKTFSKYNSCQKYGLKLTDLYCVVSSSWQQFNVPDIVQDLCWRLLNRLQVLQGSSPLAPIEKLRGLVPDHNGVFVRLFLGHFVQKKWLMSDDLYLLLWQGHV